MGVWTKPKVHPFPKVWTSEETMSFLASSKADSSRYWIGFYVAIMTGMRKGEILGLRWDDIDFDNNRLQIQRALQWNKGKATFVPPKTQKSKRTVTLPLTVTSILRMHKARQNEYKLKLGPIYKDQGLLFTSLDGSPVQPRVVDEHWYQCRNSANVPKIRFHDLRHTHASLLLELGIHPKVVSERLGHSEVGITMNLYSHVMPGMQEKAAQDFEQAVFGSASK